jgi:pyrroline-5-carboxylate reductase
MVSIGKIGFIGGGNMGEALIKGLIKGAFPAADIWVAEPVAARRALLAERYGVVTEAEGSAVVAACDLIVLAVKPQLVPKVLPQLATTFGDAKVLVSIAAGATSEALEGYLAGSPRVVRVMPNTPALVGAGATAISGGSHATGSDIDQTRFVFEAVGMTVVLEEEHLDAVTGLSGSGPSYIFLIIEALTDAGVKVGLSRRNALRLAAQTVMGSAKMLLDTDGHPGQLKDMVTSPGGTAIAGLHTLEQGGLRTTLINAVESATRRSRELGARYSGADSGARNNND